MKLILHQTVERLRHTAMLLVFLLCAIGNANALTSDEINKIILSPESTITPKWTDDASNPWVSASGNSYIRTPNFSGSLSSTLAMTLSTEYPLDFTVSRYIDKYDNPTFSILVDGVDRSQNISDLTWTIYHIPLSSGTHTIEFKVKFTNSQCYACIKDVLITELKNDFTNSSILKDGSMPISFENDPFSPWSTEENSVKSGKYTVSNASSKISTTFSLGVPSLFSFEYMQGYRYSSDDYDRLSLTVRIDDTDYLISNSLTWQSEAVVLYPGTHKVEFIESHTSCGDDMWVKIRNVNLTQNWLETNLSNPGELGAKLFQSLGNDYLQDAELLKISGSMNSDDWNTISKLVNLKAVDLSGSNITTIPAKAFNGQSYLSTVMFPETLTEIGAQAFMGTNFYETTLPRSVEKIGHEAWSGTPLTFFHFENDSRLKQIDYEAFYNTKLIEFIMPDSVEESLTYRKYCSYHHYDANYSYMFAVNRFLKKLHLSENLVWVPSNICGGCTSLEEVNIPKSATYIDHEAFYNTPSLKFIEIPESVTTIKDNAFKKSGLQNIIISEAITDIGMEAFSSTKLTSVTIPKNVTSYGSNMFEACDSLKSVVLNSHCSGMNNMFKDCKSLERVVLPCATPPTITNDPFSGVTKSKIKLIIPDFASVAYGVDDYWCNFTGREVGDEASKQDYWAIRGNLTLDKEKKMQGTPSVEIFTGGSLTLDTDLNQNFNDFTYYTKETKPATFLNKSSSITANSLTTRYYVETADKWFFFSPVCDVNMSDVTYPNSESWIIRYYDGERRGTQNTNSGNWKNVPSDGVLRRGQGYIIQAKATGWLNMPVTKENQNIFFDQKELTMSLANNPSENEVNAGWNFVSNPYPCYYDVYYMNMQAPITVWTGSTYRAYALNEGDNNDDTYVLRPMQPFFVQKASTDLIATMPLVGRQVNKTINHTRVPKPNTTEANPLRNLLNLELLKYGCDEADDYTRIVINEQASMGYERTCDASKFMSMDATVAQFFSLGEDDTPMAINERPYDNGNVALGVYFPEAGETFTITATRSDRKAWLYDAETGIEQDLTEGDYMFTVNKSGYDYNRFSIRFSPVTNAVGKTENVKAKVNAGAGYISVVASEDANVSVYGTDGRVVASCMGSNNFTVPAGVYVIRVDGQTFKTIVK